MNFWFNISKNLKGPQYFNKIESKLKSNNIRILKKKPITTVKFIRQQKVFGKGGKAVVKKKTNMILRAIRLYFFTGVVQNLPPLSTILSIYNINVQKLSEELTIFFKTNFFEGVPVIILIQIFKDCTYKFFFLGVRFNFFLQQIYYSSNLIYCKKILLYYNQNKLYFDLDFWLLLVVKFFFDKQFFFFESFIRSLNSTCTVLGLTKIKRIYCLLNG